MTFAKMTLLDWLVIGSGALACVAGLAANEIGSVGFGMSVVWYLFFRDAQEKIKELEKKLEG